MAWSLMGQGYRREDAVVEMSWNVATFLCTVAFTRVRFGFKLKVLRVPRDLRA